MADRHDFVLTAMRSANPRAADAAGPAGEWSSQELLSAIEAGRTAMDTLERKQATPPLRPNRRPRGWMAAAAAFVAVILIGATIYALRPAEDPVTTQPPAPTTTSAAPTTTAAPVTTVPATALPPTTTVRPTTIPPQTHEATVTWDGAACSLEAPSEVRARDEVNFTFQNTSDDVVDFWISYLTTGFTLEDVAERNGPIDVTSPTARTSEMILVASAPGSSGFGTLQVGETASRAVELKTPRLHVVTCFGGPQPPAAETQLAVSSTTGISVVE